MKLNIFTETAAGYIEINKMYIQSESLLLFFKESQLEWCCHGNRPYLPQQLQNSFPTSTDPPYLSPVNHPILVPHNQSAYFLFNFFFSKRLLVSCAIEFCDVIWWEFKSNLVFYGSIHLSNITSKPIFSVYGRSLMEVMSKFKMGNQNSDKNQQ